jgi:hypothetical protein
MTDLLTFDLLRQRNNTRRDRWHPPGSEPWSLADWSNAMNGEAGEAANIIKKLRRIETGTDTGPWSIPHSTVPGRTVQLDRESQLRILAKGAGLELADTVIYADLLAQELTRKYGGYDLGELVAVKFDAVSHREGFPERLR